MGLISLVLNGIVIYGGSVLFPERIQIDSLRTLVLAVLIMTAVGAVFALAGTALTLGLAATDHDVTAIVLFIAVLGLSGFVEIAVTDMILSGFAVHGFGTYLSLVILSILCNFPGAKKGGED